MRVVRTQLQYFALLVAAFCSGRYSLVIMPPHAAGAARGTVVSLADLPRVPVNKNHNPALQQARADAAEPEESVSAADAAVLYKRVMLPAFAIPHVTSFSATTLRPGQAVPTHAHATMHEAFFVTAGRGHFVVDGTRHDVSRGSMVHLAPGERHSIAVDGEMPLEMTYFGVATDE